MQQEIDVLDQQAPWQRLFPGLLAAAARRLLAGAFGNDLRGRQECSWEASAAFSAALKLTTAQARLQHVCEALVASAIADFSCVCLMDKGAFGLGAIYGPGAKLFPPVLEPLDSQHTPSFLHQHRWFRIQSSTWAIEDVLATRTPWCYDLKQPCPTGLPCEALLLRETGLSYMICLPIQHQHSMCGVLVLGFASVLGPPSLLPHLEQLAYQVTPFVYQTVADLQPALTTTTPHRYKPLSDITYGMVSELINLDRILMSRITTSYKSPVITKAKPQHEDKVTEPEQFSLGAAWQDEPAVWPTETRTYPTLTTPPTLSPAQQTAAAYLSLVLGSDAAATTSTLYVDPEQRQVVASVAKFKRQTRRSVLSLDQYSGPRSSTASSVRSSLCTSASQRQSLAADNSSDGGAYTEAALQSGNSLRHPQPFVDYVDPEQLSVCDSVDPDDGLSMILRLQGSAAYTAARMSETQEALMSPSMSPSVTDCTPRNIRSSSIRSQSFKRRASITSGRPSLAEGGMLTSIATSDMLEMLNAACSSTASWGSRPPLHHQRHCGLSTRDEFMLPATVAKVSFSTVGSASTSGRLPSSRGTGSVTWSRSPHASIDAATPPDPNFVYTNSSLYAPSAHGSSISTRHSQEASVGVLPCLPEERETGGDYGGYLHHHWQ